MDDIAQSVDKPVEYLPDLAGEDYLTILRRLHNVLNPATYLEIGTRRGDSLRFADCPSVAIDPEFQLEPGIVGKKSICAFYQMPSDRYFAQNDPKSVLGGPIELAFLDGMHRCEFLLRDFMNTERHCQRNSVVVMHDCVPVEAPMTSRVYNAQHIAPHRHGWWLGDVWRTLLALRRHRDDLKITVVDAPPSGLVCITNMNPHSTYLLDNYANIVDEMMSWSLDEIGIAAFHKIVKLESTSILGNQEKINSRFWL